MDDIGESTIPIPSDTIFSVQDVVLAFHGHLLYEARVLSVHYEDEDHNNNTTHQQQQDRKVKSYRVHYQGWKKSWEEVVPQKMVFEHNDENLRVAHRLLNGAKLRQQAIQPVSSSSNIIEDNNNNANPTTTATTITTTNNNNNNNNIISTSMITEEIKNIKNNEKTIDDSIPDTPISTSTSTDHLFILPAELQRLLVDDWEFITKDCRLVSLPREPTVVDILQKWVAGKRQNVDKASKEVADALIEYFDASLPKILLYRFERKQYMDCFAPSASSNNNKKSSPSSLIDDIHNKKLTPSSVYGAEHLLRLIHKLPFMLECSSVARDTMQTVAEKVNDLTKYMQKNGRTLFLCEYPPAPKSYVRNCVA